MFNFLKKANIVILNNCFIVFEKLLLIIFFCKLNKISIDISKNMCYYTINDKFTVNLS